ncbi:MAG: hypothetical protein PF572_01315 [Patescibacteria group bacterium]|jgi:uncharacterized membrane protein YbhN (UPF0104 family)|nr:hypothetical protein [Patescibacteria group bacterium]
MTNLIKFTMMAIVVALTIFAVLIITKVINYSESIESIIRSILVIIVVAFAFGIIAILGNKGNDNNVKK